MSESNAERFFKDHQNEMLEGSQCWSCASRENCQIKESVSMEERFVCCGKFLNVTASCKKYIHNPNAKKPKAKAFMDLINGRG